MKYTQTISEEQWLISLVINLVYLMNYKNVNTKTSLG